jgi:fibronectin-binding autotransporter adhesin
MLNWAGNTLPAAGENILFPGVVNQTIDLGGNQSIGSLTFNSGTTYTLNNNTLTLGGDLTQSGAGAVNIFSGLNNGGAARVFSGAGSGEVTIGGILSGSGAITFAGGNYTLANAANSFSGSTTISGGRLTVTGTLTASIVTVSSGGTLGGSGIVAAPVAVAPGGLVSPGSGVGTLLIGDNLSLDAAATLSYELGTPNVAGGDVNDLVIVDFNLLLDGTLNITALPNFGAGTYRLFDYGGSLLDFGLLLGSAPADFDYLISSSTQGQINLIVTPIPEPGTFSLVVLGALALWMARRRAGC